MASPDATTLEPSAVVTGAVVAVVSTDGEAEGGAVETGDVEGAGIPTDVSALTSVAMVERVTDVSDAQPTSTITPINEIAAIVPTRDINRGHPTETLSRRGTKATLAGVGVSFLSRGSKYSCVGSTGGMTVDEALYGQRSARGEWTPERRASFGPLFDWPARPVAIIRWFFAFPSYLFGWNTLYAAVAIGAYRFTAPSAADAESLLDSWVLQLLGRNLLVAVAWYGLFHLRLYIQRALIAPLRPKLQWQWASQFCRHAF
jgi:hypothetical protein